MKSLGLLISLILFFAAGAFAQQRPKRPVSCEEKKERALARVTIVSNSRILMERDLATVSVKLGYARQRMARMDIEIESLRKRLDKKESETETKQPETETKATEAETEPIESETEDDKDETVGEEQTQ